MSLQKFRADDEHAEYANGAVPWYTRWIGGPSLALIRKCPTPFGPRTVYISGEPDTFFSLPARCSFRGWTINGWISFDDGADNGPIFHPSRTCKAFPHTARLETRSEWIGDRLALTWGYEGESERFTRED